MSFPCLMMLASLETVLGVIPSLKVFQSYLFVLQVERLICHLCASIESKLMQCIQLAPYKGEESSDAQRVGVIPIQCNKNNYSCTILCCSRKYFYLSHRQLLGSSPCTLPQSLWKFRFWFLLSYKNLCF